MDLGSLYDLGYRHSRHSSHGDRSHLLLRSLQLRQNKGEVSESEHLHRCE